MKKVLSSVIGVIFLLSSSLFAKELVLSGSVISDNQKMITSRYMGFAKEVRVSEGDVVKRGELLYVIDSKEIDSAKSQVELGIQQAQLSLQMYRNQYQNVKINLDRHKRLYKQDMVSKFEVENLELAEKNLKAMISIAKKQIAQAKARLKEVENQYRYLRITAPNDGVVVAVNLKVGEMAMPGMPAIVLSDLSDLKVSTEISEKNLESIKVGKEVMVEIPSVGLKAKGRISAIIPSSNPMTHTFKIKVSFDKQGKDIYPGMYATVIVK
jgi:RND family efflux transporter MFP subunit